MIPSPPAMPNPSITGPRVCLTWRGLPRGLCTGMDICARPCRCKLEHMTLRSVVCSFRTNVLLIFMHVFVSQLHHNYMFIWHLFIPFFVLFFCTVQSFSSSFSSYSLVLLQSHFLSTSKTQSFSVTNCCKMKVFFALLAFVGAVSAGFPWEHQDKCSKGWNVGTASTNGQWAVTLKGNDFGTVEDECCMSGQDCNIGGSGELGHSWTMNCDAAGHRCTVSREFSFSLRDQGVHMD